jgi:hypothetical protein
MLKMPDELAETAKFAGYQPPDLDEDILHELAKRWTTAADYFNKSADWPKEQPGTVWDPTTSWERGKDRPLDAFVDFYENYPRKHYYTVAAQAAPVAGALNNVAGILLSHRKAAYAALDAARKDLSRGGHMFGPKYITVLGMHLYLPGLTGEDGDLVDEDFATVDALKEHLGQLNRQTQQQINAQVKIIDQADAALDRVADNAAKATAPLPDGPAHVAAGNPDSYEQWVKTGR